jgi:hypothetical protein
MNTHNDASRWIHRTGPELRGDHRDRTAGAASVRLGAWLFLPAEPQFLENWLCADNAPIDEGESPACLAQEIYRTGDEDLYVSPEYPFGVSRETYRRIVRQDPTASTDRWRLKRRNGVAYVRGQVRQDGTGQLDLPEWHLAVRIGAAPASGA